MSWFLKFRMFEIFNFHLWTPIIAGISTNTTVENVTVKNTTPNTPIVFADVLSSSALVSCLRCFDVVVLFTLNFWIRSSKTSSNSLSIVRFMQGHTCLHLLAGVDDVISPLLYVIGDVSGKLLAFVDDVIDTLNEVEVRIELQGNSWLYPVPIWVDFGYKCTRKKKENP